MEPVAVWTAIGVLIVVLASVWALRGKRGRVEETAAERRAHWATIDKERGKR